MQDKPTVLLLSVTGVAENGDTLTSGLGLVCNGKMITGIKDWGVSEDNLSWTADLRQIGLNLAEALDVPLEEFFVQMAEDSRECWLWVDALEKAKEENQAKPKMGM
jgi:hypothetical protein